MDGDRGRARPLGPRHRALQPLPARSGRSVFAQRGRHPIAFAGAGRRALGGNHPRRPQPLRSAFRKVPALRAVLAGRGPKRRRKRRMDTLPMAGSKRRPLDRDRQRRSHSPRCRHWPFSRLRAGSRRSGQPAPQSRLSDRGGSERKPVGGNGWRTLPARSRSRAF